jgi:hypothetical protein
MLYQYKTGLRTRNADIVSTKLASISTTIILLSLASRFVDSDFAVSNIENAIPFGLEGAGAFLSPIDS